jgi:hypothetical protein
MPGTSKKISRLEKEAILRAKVGFQLYINIYFLKIIKGFGI